MSSYLVGQKQYPLSGPSAGSLPTGTGYHGFIRRFVSNKSYLRF